MCLPSGSQHLCSVALQDNNVKVILKSYEKMWNFIDHVQLDPLVGHHKIGSGFAYKYPGSVTRLLNPVNVI